MPHAATMNDELFRALRDDAGMPEAVAAKVARLIFQQGESAVRAGRDAERASDREVFAAKGDVTVLQSEMTDVKAAIVRIDKSIEGINATLASMNEMIARLDERMNGLESQNSKFFYVFFSLHVVTISALIGLLTKGILWAVAP